MRTASLFALALTLPKEALGYRPGEAPPKICDEYDAPPRYSLVESKQIAAYRDCYAEGLKAEGPRERLDAEREKARKEAFEMKQEGVYRAKVKEPLAGSNVPINLGAAVEDCFYHWPVLSQGECRELGSKHPAYARLFEALRRLRDIDARLEHWGEASRLKCRKEQPDGERLIALREKTKKCVKWHWGPIPP